MHDINEKYNYDKIILKKCKSNYYKFYNKLLPSDLFNNKDEKELGTIFKRINENIISKEKSNVNIIICFYELFNKFIIFYDNHINKDIFGKYIKHDNNNYCLNIYNLENFYEKIKRCYEFIKYFKDNLFDDKLIIEVLYKTGISYSKLFKIRKNDYLELKEFFYNKMKVKQNITKNNIMQSINIDKTIKNKKTILNYYESKKYLINIIDKHIASNIYINSKIYDLFSGSMSIPMGLYDKYPNNKIIINDNNKFLMDFYNVLKNDKDKLIEKINNNKIKCIVERAAWYYVFNKLAYKGKIYFTKNGNLSMIKRNDMSILTLDNAIFDKYSLFLNNVDINCNNILENTYFWINKINENDIVILDPPYHSLNNKFNNYGNIFGNEEQEKLRMFVKLLIEKGAKVIIFNNNTEFIKDLYQGLNITIINSQSSLSYSNKSEIMIYN